jgi:predicted naringenin-chalcone synthase
MIIHPFRKNNLKITDIDHLIFHPGGKKLCKQLKLCFSDLGKKY